MSYYKDFREYLKVLEKNDKLIRIKREINKETELHPLVRLQYRGLPEEDRKAFLFENVIDSKGKKYNIPVTVAWCAGSKYIYALGMNCEPEEVFKRWTEAQLHPIDPVIVSDGPAHEEVYMGKDLLKDGNGLDKLPVPLSTPGFGGTVRFTAGHWVTKDPDTGIRNIGHYSGLIKGRNKIGALSDAPQHMGIHWEKCKKKGINLKAAIILGPPPAVAYTAVAKLPYGVDEYRVSGGLAGSPIELVKCKTVDLEVPATAEIVIEGEISTEYLEPIAPFGEYCGYMSPGFPSPVMNVTCITHRKNPILPAFISQFPPSESSVIRKMAWEPLYYKFLRYDCNIPSITDVVFHEESGSAEFIVIQMKKTNPAQPWQALHAAAGFDPHLGKYFIVVDDDINPRNIDSVIWALCYRVQPHRDTKILMGKVPFLDNSAAPPDVEKGHINFPMPSGASAIIIDATRKWDYPPLSLPKREYMEKAIKIWKEEGLPPLNLKSPWYGYSLGYWTKDDEEAADLAVKGEYYKTGEKQFQKRVKVR